MDADLRTSTIDWLQEVVAGMNLDNYLVRPHRKQVETWSERHRWDTMTTDDANDILTLAGLPSSVRDSDVDAKRSS